MRSSFPEVEVTRSLSSNLLKKGFTKLSEDDARVIDTNGLVAKRIRELSAKMQKESNTGFVSGLAADKVEAPVTDPEEEETDFTPSGNVIKAGEDLQKLKEDAEAEAQKIVEDARAQAESILQDARSQAEAERTYRKRPEDRDSRKHRRKRIVQRLHEKQNIRRKRRDWKQNTRSGWTSWNLNLWTRSPEFMNIFFM